MRTTLTTAGRFVSVIIWLCKLHFLSRWELRLSFEKSFCLSTIGASLIASLARTVATIVAYATIEFVGFVGLVFLLRRKFGISPLHQLAFAFEKQAWALQGHLFVWTIVILHLRLEHYGV
ncbi:hypothetical protein PF005_g22948 [Phytophthora fragariae]|uniref:Uncharacterized protein n=1 Tax=Phytophthora fragariae TaxID=53985 RepID=A0A6A3IGN3_9STRA|nr:hypothetical protein PF009_g23737 [Phytophthora fragariae]KAE8982196.1 hypothetical protein PF011_g21710 [Phytophthora fragariae]KAE9080532.1 hypothetical protein PF007_g23014 [Phytophthora fragariae]KAE9181271.1 hypothetical protein PF005_g22948 [Phytophthora fragariae]KAE9190820.1 hypothetical protein PF004_g21789 [Phytophthora fragariae]